MGPRCIIYRDVSQQIARPADNNYFMSTIKQCKVLALEELCGWKYKDPAKAVRKKRVTVIQRTTAMVNCL
jgi:hypothetical protein